MASIKTEQLAKVLRLEVSEVQRLARSGMPKEANGEFELGKAMLWYIHYLQDSAGSDDKLPPASAADRLGITKRQLLNLAERGMPKHGHGKDVYYAWPEIRDWYLTYRLDIAHPKGAFDSQDESLIGAQTRKYMADARRAEIKLARERGEVASIQDIQRVLEQCNANVRARLIAIPGKLTPKLVNIGSKPKVKGILEKELGDALSELANPTNITLPEVEEE